MYIYSPLMRATLGATAVVDAAAKVVMVIERYELRS
jgi:hypothetical protein